MISSGAVKLTIPSTNLHENWAEKEMVAVIREFLFNLNVMEIFEGLEVLLKRCRFVAIPASIKPGLTTLQTFDYAKQVIHRK